MAITVGAQDNNLKQYKLFHVDKIGITANDSSIILPASAHIMQIVLKETAGNSITGGLDIGTAAAGAQIVSALAVSGNDFKAVFDAALLLRVFAAAQTIFIAAHTGWNSASLNVNIIYATIPVYGT
jgi:hypothetical protein